MQISTGIRNGLLGGSALDDLINGFVIKAYAGTVPTGPDSAIGSATLLNTYSNNGTGAGCNLDPTPVSGVMVKSPSETIKGTPVASGTATFWRLVLVADDGTESTTAMRIQGDCGVVGADFLLDSLVFTAGVERFINSLGIGMPAS